jgi:hypothetical protein
VEVYFVKEQLENIAFISIILSVLKLDKSKEIKEIHLKNIPLI